MGKSNKQWKITRISSIFQCLYTTTIMLPWGYSVFTHYYGYISIDITIQRCLQHCEIKLIDNKNLNKVKWSCDDYLWDDGDEDCCLINPQCKVRRKIDFIDGTMKILHVNIMMEGMPVWWSMHAIGITIYLLINMVKFCKL